MLWECKVLYEGEQEYKSEIRYAEGQLQLGPSDIKAIKSIVSKVFRYECKNTLPPHIHIGRDGIKYLVPEWTELHPQATIQDINWDAPKPKPQEPKAWKFESSSSKGEFYVVKKNSSGKLKCDCMGFIRARGNCKHVIAVKKELGLQ